MFDMTEEEIFAVMEFEPHHHTGGGCDFCGIITWKREAHV